MQMTTAQTRTFRAGEDILREGNGASHINIIVDGWACGTRDWRTAGAR